MRADKGFADALFPTNKFVCAFGDLGKAAPAADLTSDSFPHRDGVRG